MITPKRTWKNCKRCDATGYIYVRKVLTEPKRKIPCPDCHGSGIVNKDKKQ